MSNTDGQHTQDTPFSDLQFFIGASEFFDTSNLAARSTGGVGLFALNLSTAQAGTFFANLEVYLRTGVYATPALTQEQFGTSLNLPGPQASLPNSGDPDSLNPGYPPILANQMATLGNLRHGPVAKGTQVDYVNVIYTVTGAAASVATIGLTKTVFVDSVAPAVTNLIALGSNGLPTTVQATPHVFTVNAATYGMITTMNSELVLNVNLTAGAGGTVVFYGVVIGAHYNFN